jgi:predicted transposase/invertase (TIGR01784 family)
MKTRSLISFDWAMKRLLRQKANFEVLEGFLSELLRRKIVIQNIIESEGNKKDKDDKSNKVDIMVDVVADDKEVMIIELQYKSIDEYFHRMLYGVTQAISDHIKTGDFYEVIPKVYSINIVYFDIGHGDDYIYHGYTNFTGFHTKTELQLSAAQKKRYERDIAGDIFPEYYIIKVNGFNDVAKNTLDEWIYYLKNNRIEDGFTAQGLDKARELLLFDNMSEEEKEQYLLLVDEKLRRDAEMRTALAEGEIKGHAEGKAEGRIEERELTVINCHKNKLPFETISAITGLSIKQITQILNNNGLL